MPLAAPEPRWTARLWGVLAVLCLVPFLDGLDVSVVGNLSMIALMGSYTSFQFTMTLLLLNLVPLLRLQHRPAER
ncbi:hypothetical protein GCM10010103_10020 [Streptomyces paradoxus]|uniref:Uncharacterized protein n=1 Tax=Streptomyces paradoxus TaxID=66375 RepID=A0A7W9T516_9ACTN|nr:hypothetical protein [Streptomyces paradoxus]MBB6074124.1 hypothetical protein [Streptomyces paradoxus]